jgi:hypothetical protein
MNDNIDRNAFQKLLESAFVLQQSGLARRSLSAIMAVQRSMRSDALTVATGMRLVVDCVRTIADADGAAIAFVHANHLVYEAGTGSAAGREGACLGAVLSASRKDGQSHEILRVENAENDSRIEADICRQFASKALLLLPIYRDQAVAGVLEIRFTQAHVFETHEVRAYRLMTGLLEEVLTATENGSRTKLQPQPAPLVGPKSPPTGDGSNLEAGVQKPDRWSTTGQSLRDYAAEKADPTVSPRPIQTQACHQARPLHLLYASAIVTILVVLIIQDWIAYDLHRAALYSGQQHVSLSSTSLPGSPSGNVRNKVGERSLNGAFRRVRLGQNEIDYIADDVTIREFKHPAPLVQRAGLNQEFHIGDDVTVRLLSRQNPTESRTK